MPPSSSGPGYLVLSQETGVRFPLGVLKGPGFLARPFHVKDAREGEEDGRLAQLAEHIAHIDGVAGSSPAAANEIRRLRRIFF